MRIEFLTDDNPLYVLPFFDEFLRHYAARFEIVQVSTCRPMGKRSRMALLRELGNLYGPTGIARIAARWVTARTLGALPPRRGARRFHTMRQLCRAHGI